MPPPPQQRRAGTLLGVGLLALSVALGTWYGTRYYAAQVGNQAGFCCAAADLAAGTGCRASTLTACLAAAGGGVWSRTKEACDFDLCNAKGFCCVQGKPADNCRDGGGMKTRDDCVKTPALHRPRFFTDKASCDAANALPLPEQCTDDAGYCCDPLAATTCTDVLTKRADCPGFWSLNQDLCKRFDNPADSCLDQEGVCCYPKGTTDDTFGGALATDICWDEDASLAAYGDKRAVDKSDCYRLGGTWVGEKTADNQAKCENEYRPNGCAVPKQYCVYYKDGKGDLVAGCKAGKLTAAEIDAGNPADAAPPYGEVLAVGVVPAAGKKVAGTSKDGYATEAQCAAACKPPALVAESQCCDPARPRNNRCADSGVGANPCVQCQAKATEDACNAVGACVWRQAFCEPDPNLCKKFCCETVSNRCLPVRDATANCADVGMSYGGEVKDVIGDCNAACPGLADRPACPDNQTLVAGTRQNCEGVCGQRGGNPPGGNPAGNNAGRGGQGQIAGQGGQGQGQMAGRQGGQGQLSGNTRGGVGALAGVNGGSSSKGGTGGGNSSGGGNSATSSLKTTSATSSRRSPVATSVRTASRTTSVATSRTSFTASRTSFTASRTSSTTSRTSSTTSRTSSTASRTSSSTSRTSSTTSRKSGTTSRTTSRVSSTTSRTTSRATTSRATVTGTTSRPATSRATTSRTSSRLSSTTSRTTSRPTSTRGTTSRTSSTTSRTTSHVTTSRTSSTTSRTSSTGTTSTATTSRTTSTRTTSRLTTSRTSSTTSRTSSGVSSTTSRTSLRATTSAATTSRATTSRTTSAGTTSRATSPRTTSAGTTSRPTTSRTTSLRVSSTSVPRCGNDVREPGEQCGEPGLSCLPGQYCEPTTCRCNHPSSPSTSRASTSSVPRCGDGVREPGEQCGEPGLSCPRGSVCDSRVCICDPDIPRPHCGDGRVNAGEQCGEPGLSCPAGQDCNERFCSCSGAPQCGDGVIDAGEQCNEPGLRCGPGAYCEDRSCLCMPFITQGRCGNGILEQGEECDDGNARDFDGCSAFCEFERGACGDGVLQRSLGEQCEPSLHDPLLPFRCAAGCRIQNDFCGNGIQDPGEECDDAENNSNIQNARCRLDCSLATCGDGILDSTSEQCDDGNRLWGDGCDRFCKREVEVGGIEARWANGIALPASLVELPFLGVRGESRLSVIPGLVDLVRPTTQPGQTPQTGPGIVAVMAAGAAAGFAWARRRGR